MRKNERSLCADILKLRWKDKQGSLRREFASLEDISTQGVCIQVEEAVPLDTLMTIIYPSGKFMGTVKYCNLQETGYFLGIEFAEGYRWSRRHYDPPHLLHVCGPDGEE